MNHNGDDDPMAPSQPTHNTAKFDTTSRAFRRVIVVGGGASGVILCVNLARAARDIEIILIERRNNLGRGLAYATKDPTHLLNVRVANMSAFPDHPEHFFRWLQDYGPAHKVGAPTHFCFAPRSVYGEYLASLLAEETPQGVRIIRGSVADVTELLDGVRVTLANGSIVSGDALVVATGNAPRADLPNAMWTNPWSPGAFDGLDPDAGVMIVGTGLTMADVTLSLQHRGHRGQIVAVSRRGLISAVHADVKARQLAPVEVPFGAPISKLTRWVRRLVRQCDAEGMDWRSAIDALRPHTPLLWQSMNLEQRLRHARAWWEAHRHRMAPAVAEMLKNLIADGRLHIVAARIEKLERAGHNFRVIWRRRGTQSIEYYECVRVYNCAGLNEDLRLSPNPVLQALFAHGLARPDPLSLGLDIKNENALIDASGKPSERIFAIGPVARGAFWEITAVPDIRQQCFDLATHLVRKLAPVTTYV
jgi:uncharacterized NAD(P)/FAD-binding protein YdhS